MLLAIDPGEVRVGFAMFEIDKEARRANCEVMAILSPTELRQMLAMAEAMLKPGMQHQFVIENFRVDINPNVGREKRPRGNVFQFSEMLTIRQIGMLEYAAYRMNDSPVTFQEPSQVLSGAKRWAPFPMPKGNSHLADHKSAFLHGAYWLMKQKVIDTVDDITTKGQEKLFR